MQISNFHISEQQLANHYQNLIKVSLEEQYQATTVTDSPLPPITPKKKIFKNGIAFKAPNGDSIPYTLRYYRKGKGISRERRDQWGPLQKIYETKVFKRKQDHPLLESYRTKSKIHIGFVDIDVKLNKELRKELEFFIASNCIKSKNQVKHGHFMNYNCICFKSVSGKTKLAFLVELPEKGTFSKDEADEALRQILPGKLFNQVDLGGGRSCFINKKAAKQLHNLLPYLTPIRLNSKTYAGDPVKTEPDIKKRYDYRKFNGPIPKEFKIYYNSKLEENILRVLLSTHIQFSMEKGYQICQPSLANYLKTTQKTISAYIKKLIKMGFLENKSKSYLKGLFSKTYKFTSNTVENLKKRRIIPSNLCTTPSNSIYLCIPKEEKRIEDGEWNIELPRLFAKLNYNIDNFKEYVKLIKGHKKKDRWKKVEYIIKRYKSGKFKGRVL